MLRRFLFSFAILTVLVSAANAAPLFYLSLASDAASAVPGLLNKTGEAVGATGTVSIIADSDVQLSGVSLNLVSTGNAIKLTSADVPNPGGRWAFLDGPLTVGDNKISSIGGAAIPGLAGAGIGGASTQGSKVVLATFNYQALAAGTADLSLEVGANAIADWNGVNPTVFFGTLASAGVPGGVAGGAGAVGSISVGAVIPEPATLALVGLAVVGGLGLRRRA